MPEPLPEPIKILLAPVAVVEAAWYPMKMLLPPVLMAAPAFDPKKELKKLA